MTQAAPARFERERLIRFSHCDPAGIVFFPQYLVMFNQVVEDWFNEALDVPYAGMVAGRRIGLPIVRLECDFRAISRLGDRVTLGLAVERAGGRSLTLALECRAGDELRVASRQVLVFTSLETHRAIDIPPDVRAGLAAFTG
ncbi:acyl-CoA thioesterase [Xenophilus sp.]|uniref:acyl-CoA thioesterase n=1 Tax=Xenophilus sp. TaxID=1873499 RepID=UPI0037DD1111